MRVKAHQFRHTVGTRPSTPASPSTWSTSPCINHASPRMPARYAHDHRVGDASERYCRQRVNVAGEAVPYAPRALTAEVS